MREGIPFLQKGRDQLTPPETRSATTPPATPTTGGGTTTQ
jgi:hypothetical protein